MKKFLKTISVIHLALIAGQILFGAFAYIKVASRGVIGIKTNDSPFIYLVPTFAIAAVIAGNIIFNKALSNLLNIEPLKERMRAYQASLIRRYSLLEGASLFGIAACMVTSNLLYLTVSGLLVVYGVSLKPAAQKIEKDLQLTYQDKLELEEAEEVVE